MRRSWPSLKLASTQAWSSGTTAIKGAPAARRWPTCTERRATWPATGAGSSVRCTARKASRTRGGGTFDVGVLLDRGAVGQHAVDGGLLLRHRQRLHGAGQRAARGRQRGFGVLHLFATHGAAGHQRAAAGHVVLRLGHVGLQARQVGLALQHRGLQRGIGAVQRAHLAHRLRQLGFGALQGQLGVGRRPAAPAAGRP